MILAYFCLWKLLLICYNNYEKRKETFFSLLLLNARAGLISNIYGTIWGEINMALQPTNSGINYQQRVGAQFLSLMLTDSHLEDWLPGSEGVLESMRFESCDEIDDLVLENNLGTTYYLQAKRSLSLSNRMESQFYDVIDQFVREFIKNPSANSKYYLAVSSDSSTQINNRLRRLLNNIRASHNITVINLNKADKEVLDIFLTSIDSIYKKYTVQKMEYTVLRNLCERIYIVVYDVEDGLSGETACKMLLASRNEKQYDLLWRALIVDALEFASNRSIATRDYIQEKYGHFSGSENSVEGFFKPAAGGEIQIGYDIVLGRSQQLLENIKRDRPGEIKQELGESPLLLLQLYRFDESGKKRLSQFYPDNRLVMPGGIEVEVIRRCSSITGMTRYIDTYVPKQEPIVEMLGNGNGQEDNYPEAQLHKKWVTEQLQKATDLYCIHCGEPIAGEQNCIIEIDNESESLKVGYSHRGCVRPVDRDLGTIRGDIFDQYAYLKAFDYAFWVKARGQRLFAGLKKMGTPLVYMIWNQDIQSVASGRFCIKANLENGDATYVTQRGYVVRGSRTYMESMAEQHNRLRSQFEKDDPFGYTSISNTFGDYSSLCDKLEIGEEFRRCISYKCVPFTSTIRELFDVTGDYYTPLIYLTIEGSIAVVDRHIFMLTNPLDLYKYLNNWKEKIGLDFGNDYNVITLKTDSEFDNFMRDTINSSIEVIVDPWFGNRKDLVRGFVIGSYDKEMEQYM